jgi:hypothetical protein
MVTARPALDAREPVDGPAPEWVPAGAVDRAPSIPCHAASPTTLCPVTTEQPIDQPGSAGGVAPGAGSRPQSFSWRSPSSWLPKVSSRPGAGGISPREPGPGGLDEREHRFAVAASVLALGLVTAGYFVNRHSTIEKARAGATELLVAGLILIVIMFAGIIFQRAAIVGIASFIIGFEMVSGEDVFGAVFLIFGGWILIRHMRRQRAALAGGARPTRAAKATPTRPGGPPKPSKRYSPPRRSRTAARRR